MSKWSCFMLPMAHVINLVAPVTGWMYIVLSLDRLILILKPLWHYRQSYRYAVKLVAPGYVIGTIYELLRKRDAKPDCSLLLRNTL